MDLRLLLLGGLCNALVALGALAETIDVAPGPDALANAVAQAAPGDTLRLSPGDYAGPVVIGRPLSLIGRDGVRVDGGGKGSVITVDAADVLITGLTIANSGSSHSTIDSGVKLTQNAERARVADNLFLNNLVGVDVHGAKDARVAGNTIKGRLDHRMNDRGNGVYLWNAPGAVIEYNLIIGGRDGVFLNTSRDNIIRGNRMENLRFAIHYMHTLDSRIEDNVSVGNHLGFALMFSSGLVVRGNRSVGDRDHGVMLNFVNDSEIQMNAMRGGANKCLFMYNANKNVVFGNWLEHCGIGIHFTAGSARNKVWGNAFVGNRTQVKYVGTADHDWSVDGVGNFWSDNAAFDINGDGVADQPYRPNNAVDQILWTQPSSALLLGSPAVQLVRWAQSAFPSLLPGGVVDTAPLMRPLTEAIAALEKDDAIAAGRRQ
ncbi:MAG: nitrous oxide reductase family maturation protein NosD [Parvularculaceae bacterium]